MSGKKKLVVVLGSKPGAVIPYGDAIYCANAAIGYYAETVCRFPIVVSVLNPDVIHPKERKEGASGRDFFTRQFEMIIASRPERVILTRTGSFGLLRDVLADAGFNPQLTAISVEDRRMLVGKLSGCYDPILTHDFFYLPLAKKFRYAGSLTSTFLKRLLNKRKDCGSAFRPSTGILALLFAIADYGADAEYVICGIGIRKRSEYLGANNKHKRDLPQHVFADSKVLKKLSRRYHLSTTEPEIMHMLPAYQTRDDT